MSFDRNAAAIIAQTHLGIDRAPELLGWGISGYAFLSPDKGNVVKVHRDAESFSRELRVYQLLRKIGLSELHGLTIPKLKDYRWDLRSIRMGFVIAPYLLDFAGASFIQPDFSEDVMADWHDRISQAYGPNASIAYAVYDSLSKLGIYYLDLRPSNLNLNGLPDIVPFDGGDIEDR